MSVAGATGAPAGAKAVGDVLGREGVADVVAPGAVYVQVTASCALVAEAQLLHHAPGRGVLGTDGRLHAVEADVEEAVVDGEGDCGGGHTSAGVVAVDPVTELRAAC